MKKGPPHLLLVDDDRELRSDMAEYFARHAYDVEQCDNGQQALGLVEQKSFDVMVLDLVMPGVSGLDVLTELQARNSECDIVVLTGEATVESAVEAMKLGAREFLTKPISLKELDRLVRKAYEAGQLRKENQQLKAVLRRHQTSPRIIGQSPQMQEVFHLVERVGPTVIAADQRLCGAAVAGRDRAGTMPADVVQRAQTSARRAGFRLAAHDQQRDAADLRDNMVARLSELRRVRDQLPAGCKHGFTLAPFERDVDIAACRQGKRVLRGLRTQGRIGDESGHTATGALMCGWGS
jgi:DNA-binding response OmpR family regulator